MKRYAIYTVVLLTALFVAGCTAYRPDPVENREAYVNGKNLAEKTAKQDAIDAGCQDYPVTTEHMRNLDRHLEQFGPEKHKDFIRGFKTRYKDAFKEYMELYCGNGEPGAVKEY